MEKIGIIITLFKLGHGMMTVTVEGGGKEGPFRERTVTKRPRGARIADILALREESKILGRRWNVLKVVTCLQSSLWASPHRPTQCSKTGLKMSDWK